MAVERRMSSGVIALIAGDSAASHGSSARSSPRPRSMVRNSVGVSVDQAGQHDAPTGVDALVSSGGRGRHLGDGAVADDDGAVRIKVSWSSTV